MKPLHVKKIAIVLGVSLLGVISTLHANSDALMQCQNSQKEYLEVENKWSSLYTEESFLQDELNRLQSISRDVKVIIEVLKIAEEVLQTDDKLSKTETATLNLRIPKNRGLLYPDGSFAITGYEAKPLKESQKILENIATWSSQGITQVEGNISYMHPQILQLHKKAETLEATIETLCSEEMRLNLAKQEQTEASANDQQIIDRFAQKEQQRYEEVSNRRWGEIERAWVDRYYNSCRFRPCGVGIRH